MVFDWEGSGGERRGPREILEAEVEARLAAAGWDDRARAVALQPEVEIWVWSDSPEVDRILGWQDHTPALRPWLQQRQFLPAGAAKPPRPKEALAAALREVRQVPSANLFRQLGASVGLTRCTDPAFAKLRATLQAWFPV